LTLLKKNIVEHVVFISPVSLQYNFVKTLADVNNNKRLDIYIPDLHKRVSFYTIQGFVNKAGLCVNALLIIDEAHNLRTRQGKYFKQVMDCARQADRVLLMSATPIVNRPSDIVNMVALMRGEEPIDMSDFYTIIKSKRAREYLSGIFHFYERSEKDADFPSMQIVEKFFPMPKKYEKLYDQVERGEAAGVEDFKEKNIKVFYNGIRRATNKIETASPKVMFVLDKIRKNPKKKYVIFSHFKNMGLEVIEKFLRDTLIGYKLIMGDIQKNKRDEAVELYNKNQINVLLISKAGGEGLDLKDTDVIIVMEPTWNYAVLHQVIGRGVRFKSHTGKHQKVVIYRLFLVREWEEKNIKRLVKNNELVPPRDAPNDLLSIDLFLRNYAMVKEKVNQDFTDIMKKYKINK